MGDYTSTELSDALIKLGSKHGGYLSDIRHFSPTAPIRVAGPAYTVQMVPFDDKTSPKPTEHFVDAAPEGHVIVIDAPSGEWHGTSVDVLSLWVAADKCILKGSRVLCGVDL